MDKDSLWGGIFVLIISALGTGILTLHWFFNEVGIFTGAFILFFLCGVFILASDILIKAL